MSDQIVFKVKQGVDFRTAFNSMLALLPECDVNAVRSAGEIVITNAGSTDDVMRALVSITHVMVEPYLAVREI